MKAIVTGTATAWPASAPLVRGFEVAPATLADSRTLQQRVDRKYLLSTGQLEPLLRRLQSEHLLLLAGDTAWARYESVYFDSNGRELFHAHRRGLMPRYKVRIRHHVDRQLSFLELKRKERGGRTVKFRRSLPFGQGDLGTDERRFIEAHAPVDPTSLVPALTISFLRLTLLGRTANERVTLDHDLVVIADGRIRSLPPAVIAEVKQPRRANHAGAVAALRDIHARETPLSKYCLGTVLSAPVPGNVFKPLLHALERLTV